MSATAGGAMLVVLAIWLLTQVLAGQMLQRLGIVAAGAPAATGGE